MTKSFLAILIATALVGTAIAAPPIFGLFANKAHQEHALPEFRAVPVSESERRQTIASFAVPPITATAQSEEVVAGLNEKLDILLLQDFAGNGI